MQNIQYHNESTTRYITVTFTDKDGNQEIPTSIRYKLTDATHQIEVAPWTSITPSASTVIIITSVQNAIQGTGNQTMVLTIEATDATGELTVSSDTYVLVDLPYYP